MFESLTDKLQSVFDKLATKGKLTEADVNAAMREVRLALLEADVNYKVVKEFIDRAKARSIGVEVMESLTPAQQVVKIVHEELIELLGKPAPLNTSGQPPHVVMLVGLQGAGKTTMAAKLALRLKKNGQRPLLAAADIYRPAAIKQLELLGAQIDVPVYSAGTQTPAPTIAKDALKLAREKAYTVLIVDTAGRLQIDSGLMQELEQVRMVVRPSEILLVVDAMTGQEAVNVAEGFNTRVPLTGLIMTKIDGDARGGAALSVRQVTGVPIKFLGTGEKLPDLEAFEPERLAGRILGMGDVLTLIERAQEQISEVDAAAMEKRLGEGQFDFEDFLEQLKQVKRLGPITDLLGMIPGMNRIAKDLDPAEAQSSLKKTEAIINSMTLQERRQPDLLNASRRRRIAAGSGTTVQDVNQLVKQFREMQKMMKQLGIMGKGKKNKRKKGQPSSGQRGNFLPSALSDLLGGR
ncbi:MAG: signal recognition particle protein [Chloroflexi bacterium]|nr:signal recognition particle protein [Chloroflexota bacterium]